VVRMREIVVVQVLETVRVLECMDATESSDIMEIEMAGRQL
jgi:hypothetical protein